MTPGSGTNTQALVGEILKGYPLPVWGLHGVAHWARVLENGLRLARATGASAEIVTLFALFHDARRRSESRDEGHGLRGAELAQSMRGGLFRLADSDFDSLYTACRLHTEGLIEGAVAVQVCWDADRLDLGRVGIAPKPTRLCTNAARMLLGWAHERAVSGHVPDIVTRSWLASERD